MTSFRLADCRGPVRILCTGFLLTAALGLLVSVLQVHATMGGMRPDAIADTIAGPTGATDSGGYEEDALFAENLDAGKSYGSMLQTAHTHSLAIPMLYALLGAIFLGTSLHERTRSTVLALSFVVIALDLSGLWLTRYVSRAFAYWTLATGMALFALGAVLIGRSLWDLWITSPTTQTESGQQ